MHRGVSAPSCCAFIHRVAFKEVSGHRPDSTIRYSFHLIFSLSPIPTAVSLKAAMGPPSLHIRLGVLYLSTTNSRGWMVVCCGGSCPVYCKMFSSNPGPYPDTRAPHWPSRPRRGIASPVAIRRGEGAQRKRCRDPRCSPRGNPACRGTFGLRSSPPLRDPGSLGANPV